MRTYVSKVTSRGQITIPQQLREQEGITENDYVILEKIGDCIVIGKAQLSLRGIARVMKKEAKMKGFTKANLLKEINAVRKARAKNEAGPYADSH